MALINLTPGLAKNDTASALEDTTTTGNVLSNDTLLGSVAEIQFGGTAFDVPSGGSKSLAGNFGTLTIGSDGKYAYNPFDSLREGQTGTDTFTYTGILLGLLPGLPLAGSNADLIVKATGVNDLSMLKSVVSPAAITEVLGDSSAQDIAALAGSLKVSDLDVGDPLTAHVVGTATVSLAGAPNFVLPAGAAAVADTAALTFGSATSKGGEVTLDYSYDPAAANLDFLREGQTLTVTYAVAVNDGVADSNTQNVVVSITGTNDVPVLSALAAQPVSVAELGDASAQNLAPISGSFSVLDKDVGDTLTATQVGSAVVQLNGSTITNGFPAALTAAAAFTLVNPGASTGAAQTLGFTYDPAAANLDFLRASDSLTVSYGVKLNDGLADSATQNVTFSIKGSNDAAIIGTPGATSVTEDAAVVAGNLVASGSISISDLDRDEAFFQTTVVPGAGNLGSLALAANGSYTYSVANSAVQFLGAGETKTDSFTISALDGTSKPVSFTVTGVNDPAVIGDPSNASVTEDASVVAGNLVASGSIPISDVDQNQSSFQTTVAPRAGNLGSLSLAANGSYSYTVANSAVQFLGAGQTKTDSFTVTALDGTSKLVSFTITGVNDAAVIGDPNKASVTEDVSVVAGNLVASGSIPISDVDQNQSSFQTTVTPGAGSLGSLSLAANGSYTYTVANSAVQFLGAGQTKTDSFTVTALDGTTRLVNFTVNGSNDAAVIGDPNNTSVTEDVNVVAGNLVASGSIVISDVDQNQSSFQTTVIPGAGSLGSLSLAANGSYSYTVANSAVQFLGAGQTKTDSFTVTALDGTAKLVSFTINGANDAAVIGDPDNASVTEDVNVVAGNLLASGSIPISDVDQNQAVFQTNVTPGAGNLGSLTLAADGSYSYSVSNAAVQFLNTGETRVDSFTVSALDGTTRLVNFTINGANDNTAPTIQNISPPFTVNEQLLPSAQDIDAFVGLFTVQDVDVGNTLSAHVVNTTVLLNGVAFTLSPESSPVADPAALLLGGTATSNGGNVMLGYGYDPTAADLSFLNTGDVLTIIHTVAVNDGTADSTNTRDIVITVNGINNVLNGGPGDDSLFGGNGIDTISGNDGNDAIVGGRDNDILFGGAGNDFFSINLSTDGADRVDSGPGRDDLVGVGTAAAGQVRITFTGADVGNGDALDGNNAANEDGGLAVRVQLEDASGGLTGPVSRYDDEGVDFSPFSEGVTFDVRNLGSGAQLGDQFDSVTFGTDADDGFGLVGGNNYANVGGGDDAVQGLDGDDFLDGGAGNDFLAGGEGNDTLVAGAGSDYVGGDEGVDLIVLGFDGVNDAVVFKAGQSNPTGFDTITGFDRAFDRIDLDDAFIVAPPGPFSDPDSDGLINFNGTEADLVNVLISANGQLLPAAFAVVGYETTAGDSYFFFDANGNRAFDTAGPGAADVFVKIEGVQFDPASTFV